MMQRFFRKLVKFVLGTIARVEIHGYEKLPEGGFILAANHLGRLDPAILYYAIDRDKLFVPVAEKYEHHPIYGPMVRMAGGTFIDRYNPDIHAVRELLSRLKDGGILAIAPEGTRSKTEALQEAKPGVVFFAMKANVPIVPIAIAGTEDRVVKNNLKRLKRSRIVVHAGDPITVPVARGKDREAIMEEVTEEMMCQIAALLPEKYRGVYADHPRLKELLEKQ